MNRRETDLIVIGAGAVGENVADRASQGVLDTVIVEAELVGGECSYWACMPSKALLRSPQILTAARAVPGAAEAATGELDVAEVLKRRDAFTSDWSDEGQVRWLENAGIDLVRGHGRLSGEREVTVTDAEGLEAGGHLEVDDTMLVRGFDWLYAVGDVNGRAPLTHQGKYQARAAGDVIAARARGERVRDETWGAHVATADHSAVPQVVFTDPEVAAVGLTEAQAREREVHARTIDFELGQVAGASLLRDGYDGFARMIVDEDRRVLVGVTFVGPDVAELLHAATTAIVGEIPIERLRHAVPSYPTVSEISLRLLESYGRPS